MIFRLLHILVSFYLLVSLTGFSVSVHYCGDDLKTVAIDREASSCCDSSCNSCNNEHHYVKLEEDISTPVYHFSPEIAQLDLMATAAAIYFLPVTDHLHLPAFRTESPPGRTGPENLSVFQAYLL